ncbi:MAG: TraR/DksA C4-type zinc finger protein [Actinomycetota bacterium]|nr:TraR/DksA C4-type zinc finger protein [Actinomycetota bacterium]
MDLQIARTRLEQMLADLRTSDDTLRGEGGDTGELSTIDQHPADIATDVSDVDRGEAMLEVITAQQEQVRAALQRVEDGTYGKCVVCGVELSDERLEARPEAARCIPHQQAEEASR